MIYAGVDGTGPSDNGEYAAAFADSFVMRMYRTTTAPGNAKQYLRGPNTMGMETGDLARRTAAFVRDARQCVTEPTICVAGYSRGGAAVIAAAEELKPVVVEYMVLFDAVARTSTVDASTIPSNVKTVWHIRRDPAARSRTSFGNCGTQCESDRTSYTERYFLCTHGGVGGCPWCKGPGWNGNMNDIVEEWNSTTTTVVGSLLGPLGAAAGWYAARTAVTFAQDLAGSEQAWNWISPLIRGAGIIV